MNPKAENPSSFRACAVAKQGFYDESSNLRGGTGIGPSIYHNLAPEVGSEADEWKNDWGRYEVDEMLSDLDSFFEEKDVYTGAGYIPEEEL
jgi:hypothetical protein